MSLVYAVVVYFRRPAPGATAFSIFALVIAFWVLFRSFEAGAVELADKIFWGKMMYIGTTLAGPTWLIFSLKYTGIKWSKKNQNLVWLFVVAAIVCVLVWTNQYHGFIWPEVYPSPGTNGVILVWVHGWAWWIAAAFNYFYFLVGVLIFWRYLFRNRHIYGWQIGLLLVGTCVPVAANIVYVIGSSPIEGLDLTPFGITVAGLFYAVIIFRFHFLDVVPVARRVLVEKIPDGMLVLDNDKIIMDANPSALRLLAGNNKDFVGRHISEVWPQLENVLDIDGKYKQIEIKNPSLQERYLEIYGSAIANKKNEVVGELVVLRDITERRKIERSMRESEAKYGTLVEQSNEAVLIFQNDKLVFANRTLKDMTGYTLEEINSRAMIEKILGEDLEAVRSLERTLKAGMNPPEIVEMNFRHKNGNICNVEISLGKIDYQGAEAMLISVRDITERKQTQKKLEKLYEQERKLRASLQEEIEKRSKYTRALVHELNTPLTAILASGELLESEIEDETLMALVKNIRRSSNNLKQRIEELIELARGEIGLLKINAVPLKIRELLQEIGSEMEPLARHKGLEFKVETGELPEVMGDHERLKQVVLNLVSNALKYTQQGKIEIGAEVKGATVEVRVQDSGRGIGEEEMENLFDPYRRKGNEGQELSGLGIGLALSKMIVESHGGKISVESQKDKGSIFRFTVPILHK